MSHKSKATAPKRKQVPPYLALTGGPPPTERLEQLLQPARERGLKPMTEDALDAMEEVWPNDEDLDDFLAWLRESRREGKR